MVVTNRIAAVTSALALACALAACGDSAADKGASGEPPETSGATSQDPGTGNAEDGSEGSNPEGALISVKALDETSVEGLCQTILGDVSEVAKKTGFSEYVDPKDYAGWRDSFEKEVGHSTLGCRAVSSSGSSDQIGIYVMSNLASHDNAGVVAYARSNTNEADFSFQFNEIHSAAERDELINSGDIERFLENDVLPHFEE